MKVERRRIGVVFTGQFTWQVQTTEPEQLRDRIQRIRKNTIKVALEFNA